MSNTSGAYPIDPSTQVGFFRSELGDIVATNISGDTADYEYISDAYITALIAAYPTQPDVALAKAAISMGNQMIAAAQNIQVSDIKINTIQRAQLMIDAANVALTNALTGDANSGFGVVGLMTKSSYHQHWVEGQPYQFPYRGEPVDVPGIIGESGF